MNEKQKAKIIIKTLNKIYPKAPVPLKSKNTFTLLISVLLSAQCTDVNVNNVTKDIYPKYYKPEHFVKLGRRKIEKLIKKIGIFRVKAKSIYLMSKQVLEKHRGRVPKTFEELEKLPGVGHKTASVVMSHPCPKLAPGCWRELCSPVPRGMLPDVQGSAWACAQYLRWTEEQDVVYRDSLSAT